MTSGDIWRRVALVLLLSCGGPGPADAEPWRAALPPALAPWVRWALLDAPDPACPWLGDLSRRECLWTGPLAIELRADGARFALEVDARAAGSLALPGGEGRWPLGVTRDGQPLPVAARDGVPTVDLPAGRHRLAGEFSWSRRPESLPLPPGYALVSLRRDGALVSPAPRGPAGELWLAPLAPTAAPTVDEALRVSVFRRVIDEVPLQVETHIEFEVSGLEREMAFEQVLPDGAVPMSLESTLPARLDADGRLRVQLRPGAARLSLVSRQPGPVPALARPAGGEHWPDEEIWVFDARPALRVVEVVGATPVDPRQTGLPEAWRTLPAWRLAAGDALALEEQRRGDPDPAPDRLTLRRQIWLDFDGGGYTVQDRIEGQMTRDWRIDAGPGLVPGRVVLDDEAQFITTVAGRTGVEVRRGALSMVADSRIADRAGLDAVGWARDFDAVSATLHLPPGWSLWSARGVDRASDGWLLRWSLLDLFVVFLVALAAGRLWSRPLGLLTLLALVASWHEPGAPRQVWLHVLVACALVRVLPPGRLASLARAYDAGARLALLVVALAFAAGQLRVGLFPQLARDSVPAPRPAIEALSAVPAPPLPAALKAVDDGVASSAYRSEDSARALPAHDPLARVQTGPGLPTWQWRPVTLDWQGPVAAGQALELILVTPTVNLGLAVVRVALLLALLASVLRAGRGAGLARGAALAALLLAGGSAQADAAGDAVVFPPPELLEQLRQRALEPPACAPSCASLPRLAASLADGRLRLRLELHVAAAHGVPVPGRVEGWQPDLVLVDGAAPVSLRRDEQGTLLLALEPGVHEILLDGPVPDGAGFELALPLVAEHSEVSADGWRVDGPDAATGRAQQLLFARQAPRRERRAATGPPAALPPFFALERRLELGLEWRVHTRLLRLTPAGTGVALAVPLVDGEAVTTPGVQVENGFARVELGAEARELAWESTLQRRDRIALRAADSTQWAETWQVEVAPTWHLATAGLPAVHPADAGRWSPTWRPWPGESVTLTVTRPAGVSGRTLTVERSELAFTPGRRATDVRLGLSVRSSQGGQHVLTLPPGSALQRVAIDGASQPLQLEGGALRLPVAPREQWVDVEWRSGDTLARHWRAPRVDLGTESVNATLTVALPADRWVLAVGGPRLGPAVLFWGVAGLVVVIALALGRARLAPLSTLQWLLLGIGLTQTSVAGAVLVVGWLLALAARRRLSAASPPLGFNLAQVGLALLTVAALAVLFDAVRHGLLGAPEMQIAGNGSSARALHWFQDRLPGPTAGASVWSVSIWWYRALMLAWALWLAAALLGWLRFGWGNFSAGGLWRRGGVLRLRPRRDAVVEPGGG